MIFVTVGNATEGFRRLLDAVDRMAGQGAFGNESVFMQTGNNPDFRPTHCRHEPFMSMEEFVSRVREATLVICHAGVGTLFHVLSTGKVPVVVPRRKQYGEHVDDHQLELVQALAPEGRVIPVLESEDLPEAIAKARRASSQAPPPPPYRMLSLVSQAISELTGKDRDFTAMRLLFINRYFYPDSSATSQLLTELAEDLDASGDAVTIIAGRSAYQGGQELLPAKDRYKNIQILRVSSSHFGRRHHLGRLLDYLSFYFVAAWETLRLKRQDCVVVLSDPPLLSVLAAVIAMFKPCKTVCWLQDIFPDIAVQAGVLKKGRVTALLQSCARWSLKRMDRIVVIGRCMERRLLALGLSETNIVRVPNWADGFKIQSVSRRDNPVLVEPGLHNRFVVMYSGNFGLVHEYETIRAMIAGLQHVEDICFCFIGDGFYRTALASEVDREGWKNVLFVPYQKKERLRFSLAAADVHLVSLRSNMLGCSVPSKMYGILAAGRPIIYIGPKESEAALLIKEAQCGDVLEPGDYAAAIEAVLVGYRNRDLLKRRGLAGRSYFETHCDRRIQIHRFRRVLEEIAS